MGWSAYYGGVVNATLWNENVTDDLASTLGFSAALAINNNNQIVGTSFLGGNQYGVATLWSAETISSLGTLPGGKASSAVAINDAGQVVGSSWVAGESVSHATMWSGGSIIDLGVLPGSLYSEAAGINEAEQVVGVSGGLEPTPFSRATLWEDGSIIDLNTDLTESATGWLLEVALAINNRGQIVGYGLNPFGQETAFLLTPVPEPSTWALMLFGFAGLGYAGYRRAGAAATA